MATFLEIGDLGGMRYVNLDQIVKAHVRGHSHCVATFADGSVRTFVGRLGEAVTAYMRESNLGVPGNWCESVEG